MKRTIIVLAYLTIGFFNAGYATVWWQKEFAPLKLKHYDVTAISLFMWPSTIPLHIEKDVYTKYHWQVPFTRVER